LVQEGIAEVEGQCKRVAAGGAGGRDEETSSKYAIGVRVKIGSELEAATAVMWRIFNFQCRIWWVKCGV